MFKISDLHWMLFKVVHLGKTHVCSLVMITHIVYLSLIYLHMYSMNVAVIFLLLSSTVNRLRHRHRHKSGFFPFLFVAFVRLSDMEQQQRLKQ